MFFDGRVICGKRYRNLQVLNKLEKNVNRLSEM
jgi:hypothetical protein